MTHLELVPVPPVAQLAGVSQHYGKTVALWQRDAWEGCLASIRIRYEVFAKKLKPSLVCTN